jgi:hypothetical protein
MNLYRTQIYLPKELHLQAKSYAESQSVSLAEVIRTALENLIKNASLSKKKYDLMDLHGSIKGGPKDLGRNLNKYLKEMYHNKKYS